LFWGSKGQRSRSRGSTEEFWFPDYNWCSTAAIFMIPSGMIDLNSRKIPIVLGVKRWKVKVTRVDRMISVSGRYMTNGCSDLHETFGNDWSHLKEDPCCFGVKRSKVKVTGAVAAITCFSLLERYDLCLAAMRVVATITVATCCFMVTNKLMLTSIKRSSATC